MLLLGIIQAKKGSPRTHDVIFANVRKTHRGSIGRALKWESKDSPESQCCVIRQDALSAA